MVINPKHPYHLLANSMVKASEFYPRFLLRPIPSWFKELTYEPVSTGVEHIADHGADHEAKRDGAA
jgi:hypothetical protein